MEKVGKDGVITVEDQGSGDRLGRGRGDAVRPGYISPYFVTDPTRMEDGHREPYILLHEKKVSVLKDLLPLLEQVAKLRPPC